MTTTFGPSAYTASLSYQSNPVGSHGWAKFAHRFILFNRLILMIKVVSWNVAKRQEPWLWLDQMGREGKADVALVQEASRFPSGNENPHSKKAKKNSWDKHPYDPTLQGHPPE